ncbi:Na/Pi cotransporter family protein [Methylovirgula sp. 4M-Z18]|uniref:Na/Pi cotransporter family protein n=1 Tax=Methylovirgula sp. 4M-Z18 TaxID=2293567 RepID=UPI0013145261|nr:Na/Pi cotransporter family protein [Methylovirgula sp. 4M-Z18]
MNATQLLLHMMGSVALLYWGIRMVRTGATRAFGAALRRMIAACSRSRVAALTTGATITAVIQSSMATSLLTSALIGRGQLSLSVGLAIMLGANVGTTLAAQILSFDVKAVWAVLVFVGVALHTASEAGKLKGLGRMAIGLGLIMLGLTHIDLAVTPLTQSAAFKMVLGSMSGAPVIAVLVAALITWAVHSSLSVVLIVMALAAAGALPIPAALALVLGANLGGAFTPYVEQSAAAPAVRRLPLGNLIVRLVVALPLLAVLGPVAGGLGLMESAPARVVINFHTAYNVLAAILALPFCDALANLCSRLLPDPPQQAETVGPRYLDENVLDQPPVALADALREVLHVGDKIEVMLRNAILVLENDDQKLMKQVASADDEVDTLYEAIKHYLMQISRSELSEDEAQRYVDILAFATNLEHMGDIIDKNLMELAAKKIKNQLSFSAEGIADIRRVHAHVVSNLRLALNIFTTGNITLARRLIAEKVALRDIERVAADKHFARLREGRIETVQTSSIHLDVLRDLKRINSHITSVAYQILDAAGELQGSRLKGDLE